MIALGYGSRLRQSDLRDKIVFQAAQEKNRYVGYLGKDILAYPVLVAETGKISSGGKDPNQLDLYGQRQG